jgi:hypothetical protein
MSGSKCARDDREAQEIAGEWAVGEQARGYVPWGKEAEGGERKRETSLPSHHAARRSDDLGRESGLLLG